MENPRFKRLSLKGWRQFGVVDIELHDRLTILTGANGAGKSSLLRIFSRHIGFDRPYLATPRFVEGKFSFIESIFSKFLNSFGRLLATGESSAAGQIGSITYSDGQKALLTVPQESSAQYHLRIDPFLSLQGVHIDSHQPVARYQEVSAIPANLTDPERILNHYNNEVRNWYVGHNSGVSPVFRMKEAIVSMVMFGEANRRTTGNPLLVETLDGFVEVLKKVLPPTLGFRDLEVRQNEIVVRTRTGIFMLDAASGGIATIFDITWRIYMLSRSGQSFVVTMDEPENHLHPSMQRSLLGRLLDAFPNAQFIVATHSPFIISSVRESYVYVLRYRDPDRRDISPETLPEMDFEGSESRIHSERLETFNRASSANRILREVLGVEATVPEWVVNDVQKIASKYSRDNLSVGMLEELRADLKLLGYEDEYPAALAAVMDGRHD